MSLNAMGPAPSSITTTTATLRHAPHQRERIADALAVGLAALPSLSRDDLLERWTETYGHPPPKGISRRLLEYAAAYQVQSRALGGLKPAVRRKLRQQDASDRNQPSPTAKGKVPKTLPSGSRLVREWHGTVHTVDVLEDGVLYNGRRYRSLSEVARAITGARWSGPRFFGL